MVQNLRSGNRVENGGLNDDELPSSPTSAFNTANTTGLQKTKPIPHHKSQALDKVAKQVAHLLSKAINFPGDPPSDEDPGHSGDNLFELEDDTMAVKIDKAFLGTVVMSVVPLSPRWGEGTAANRPLNQANVDALKASFALGVHLAAEISLLRC